MTVEGPQDHTLLAPPPVRSRGRGQLAEPKHDRRISSAKDRKRHRSARVEADQLVRRLLCCHHGGRALDPPPLKWSALKYGFESLKEDGHGKTTQARRDRREAAAG